MDAHSISKAILLLPLALPSHLTFRPIHKMAGLFLLFCLAGSAHGQTSTTQWWNPTTWGAQEGGVRKSTFFNNTPKKSTDKPLLSMPKMPWSSDKPATEPTYIEPKVATAEASTGPSMLSKMSQSTKRTWNNTVDFLNPFEKEPAQPVQQGYQPQNMTKKKGSGMFGWMWREETTETPTSVNEFLRQERPRF